MAPPPMEPPAFLVDKFVRIKHNDLARLHGAVPIGERARLDRENYQLFIFIDGAMPVPALKSWRARRGATIAAAGRRHG